MFRTVLNPILCGFLFIILTLTSNTILFADAEQASEDAQVASILMLKGKAAIVKADGEIYDAGQGDALFVGDRIETRNRAILQVSFLDGSTMRLAGNTDFTIDDYYFTLTTEAPRSSISIDNGTLGFMAGKMSKIAPQNYKLQTSTATIGIRGSGGEIVASDGTQGKPAFTRMSAQPGHVLEVSTAYGDFILDDPEQGLEVTTIGVEYVEVEDSWLEKAIERQEKEDDDTSVKEESNEDSEEEDSEENEKEDRKKEKEDSEKDEKEDRGKKEEKSEKDEKEKDILEEGIEEDRVDDGDKNKKAVKQDDKKEDVDKKPSKERKMKVSEEGNVEDSMVQESQSDEKVDRKVEESTKKQPAKMEDSTTKASENKGAEPVSREKGQSHKVDQKSHVKKEIKTEVVKVDSEMDVSVEATAVKIDNLEPESDLPVPAAATYEAPIPTPVEETIDVTNYSYEEITNAQDQNKKKEIMIDFANLKSREGLDLSEGSVLIDDDKSLKKVIDRNDFYFCISQETNIRVSDFIDELLPNAGKNVVLNLSGLEDTQFLIWGVWAESDNNEHSSFGYFAEGDYFTRSTIYDRASYLSNPNNNPIIEYTGSAMASFFGGGAEGSIQQGTAHLSVDFHQGSVSGGVEVGGNVIDFSKGQLNIQNDLLNFSGNTIMNGANSIEGDFSGHFYGRDAQFAVEAAGTFNSFDGTTKGIGAFGVIKE